MDELEQSMETLKQALPALANATGNETTIPMQDMLDVVARSSGASAVLGAACDALFVEAAKVEAVAAHSVPHSVHTHANANGRAAAAAVSATPNGRHPPETPGSARLDNSHRTPAPPSPRAKPSATRSPSRSIR
jgi:hypothetical protein